MRNIEVLIVSGSHHLNSQSVALAHYLTKRLSELELFNQEAIALHDLAEEPLALWQHGFAYPKASWLESAAGVILISPDWHGMATPAIKNWFLYLQSAWLAHKPVLLCGVSSGGGGLYPVLEMRSFGFKNFRPNFIPEHIVVREVKRVLDLDIASSELSETRTRIDYSLQLFNTYLQSFKAMQNALPKPPTACAFGL